MHDLSVASYTILACVMGTYWYVYHLYRRRYFLWVSLAWGLNAIYIRAEALVSPDSATFAALVALTLINSISTFCFYLAFADLRVFERRKRYYLAGAVFAILAILTAFSLRPPDTLLQWRSHVLLTVVALVTAIPLISLAVSFALSSPDSLLVFLRDRSFRLPATRVVSSEESSRPSFNGDSGNIRQALDTTPFVNNDVRRSLAEAKSLLVGTLILYGTLQLAYPFRPWLTVAHPVIFESLFWIGLTVKAIHGVALPYWILADFQSTGEALRTRSVAEELGVLTASIEHDIRNPIGNLRKELDSAKRHYQHDSSLVERLTRMNRQVSRILAAADIIPTTREIADKYRSLSEDFNVVGLISNAADSVKKLDRTQHLRMDVSSVRSDIQIHGDKARLTQALVNIINNGVEAARARDERASQQIQIRTRLNSAGDHVVITVRDNGAGIPHDLLSKITRPFFSTKTDQGRNRGIGLFIASRVIRMHNGNLDFETDGQTYTEVIISLPIVGHKRREAK